MDPILAAAVRQMMRQADDTDAETFMRGATSGKYGAADAQKYLATIRTPSTGQMIGSAITALLPGGQTELADPNSGARALIRSGVQGATGNWADEILGKLPSWLGGGKSAEEEMRLRDEAFQRAHPIADLAARGGGALSMGLLAPEIKTAGLLGTVAKGAAIGAGSSGAAAAGAQEGDLADRLNTKTALAAGTGAVLGGGIPAALGATRYIGDPSRRAAVRLTDAIRESGGLDAVRAQNAAAAGAGRGNEAMLGDLTGDLRAATDYAANNAEHVRVPLEDFTHARQGGMASRLSEDLRTTLGRTPDASKILRDLMESKNVWASGPQGYGGLRANTPIVPNTVLPSAAANVSPELAAARQTLVAAKNLGVGGPALAQLEAQVAALTPAANPTADTFASVLNQPKVADALHRAQRAGLIGEAPTPADVPTFDKMLALRQDMDGMISRAFRSKDNDLGFALKEARHLVTQHLDDQIPGFAQVDAEYGVRSQSERVLQKGVKAWDNSDPNAVAREFAGLTSDTQRDLYRTGLASQLNKKLQNAHTNRDVAAQLTQRSAAMNDKLRLVFDTKDQFDKYMNYVKWEADLAKQRGSTAGSATHRRGAAAGDDPLDQALGVVGHGFATVKRVATSAIARNARSATTAAAAERLGNMLTTRGTQNIDDFLTSFAKRPPFVGPLASQAVPAALSGLLSRY